MPSWTVPATSVKVDRDGEVVEVESAQLWALRFSQLAVSQVALAKPMFPAPADAPAVCALL